ncbi:MAG: AI-2E family transporter [Balneolaceae bacterium]
MESYPFLVKNTFRLFFAFLIIAALLLARQLLVPLFLSVLVAYLLFPYASWLEDHKVPRIAANLIVIIGFLAVLAGIFIGIGALSSNLTENLSEIKEQFESNISSIKASIMSFTGMSEAQIDSMAQSFGETGEYLSQLFTATANTVLNFVLLPVYTFLFLFYRNKFREFVFMKIDSGNDRAAEKIIDQASKVVPKYLKGLIIVCTILVVLNSVGFMIIGLEYAILLGIIAALFNLIPYLGTILGYGVVILFVFGTQSSSLALAVAIQFFIIQFIENNILTPNITGSYMQINPFVTIFSLIAASTLWGVPGMLIVMPYLGLFKIVCENVEKLKPLNYLLGTAGTEKYNIDISTIKKKFGWSDDEEDN